MPALSITQTAADARIANLEGAIRSVLKSVDDGIVMVRPSDREEFMELLGQWNAALAGETE